VSCACATASESESNTHRKLLNLLFCFYRHELVRSVAGDLVESVTNIDTFAHPKSGRVSHCYRINYRSMDRSLTNEEIDALQESVRELASSKLGVELR